MGGISTDITDAAKNFLISVGTNLRYGARPLRRTVREYLEFPIATFIGEGELKGHVIRVDFVPEKNAHGLSFDSRKAAKNSIIAAAAK